MFLTYLISTVVKLYVAALLIRVWMQWARADYYNPFAQMVVRITQPVLRPLRRIIPAIGPIDTAAVVLAYILITVSLPLIFTQPSSISVVSYLLLGLAGLVKAAGSLLFWILIIRAIMSWISQGRSPVDYLLYQLTEPLMAPIRRIIPTFGGLDFSVMIIIFILTGLNYLGYDILGPVWGAL